MPRVNAALTMRQWPPYGQGSYSAGMTLSDLSSPGSVLVPLEAETKEAAVAALVGALALTAGAEELAAAVLAREAAGSTGIGRGVAIPHARSATLKAPRLAAGLTAKPLDFAAADGRPVTLVFLLAVPEADPKSHLKALAALSRLAQDAKRLRALMRAPSPREFLAELSQVNL